MKEICNVKVNIIGNIKLVGGFSHLEKSEKMGRIIPYIMGNKKWLKPPTSNVKYWLILYNSYYEC